MANKRILLDKSEMVLMVPGKKKMETYNLNSSQITRIQFDPCVERTFVAAGVLEHPIVWGGNRVQLVYLMALTKEKNKL